MTIVQMNVSSIVQSFNAFLSVVFKGSLLAFLICFGNFAHAQNCAVKANVETIDAWSTLPSVYDFGGSTFTACETGFLTEVSFKVQDTSATQPKAMLFLENGVGNGVKDNQSLAEYVQDISIPGNGATAIIKLTTPFPVVKGSIYTWYVQKDPNAGQLVQSGGIEPNNTYAGGSTWYNNEIYPGIDNVFSVTIKATK